MLQTKYFNTTIHFWRSWFLSINFVEVVTASGVCEELPKPSSTEEEDSNNILCAGRVGAAPRLCCWRWRGSERRGSAWRLEASRVLRVVQWSAVVLGLPGTIGWLTSTLSCQKHRGLLPCETEKQIRNNVGHNGTTLHCWNNMREGSCNKYNPLKFIYCYFMSLEVREQLT